MYCPKCSQQQASVEVRFCPRCGFSLGAVRELIGGGGGALAEGEVEAKSEDAAVTRDGPAGVASIPAGVSA